MGGDEQDAVKPRMPGRSLRAGEVGVVDGVEASAEAEGGHPCRIVSVGNRKGL